MANRILALVAFALLAGCTVTPTTATTKAVLDPGRPILLNQSDLDEYTCPVGMAMSCSAGNRISALCQCLSTR